MKTKIFFDTEFINHNGTLHLLSIGVINLTGIEYYAELDSTDRSLADAWVKENVIPFLNGPVKSINQIAYDLMIICGKEPEFWAYFGLFDMKILRNIFDSSIYSWPTTWPNDVIDIAKIYGDRDLPQQNSIKHHALNDALWVKKVYETLTKS